MDYLIMAEAPPSWFWPVFVVAFLITLAVIIVVQAFLYWIVSKLVMPATGTFSNALRYIGYRLLLGLAMGVFVGGLGTLLFTLIGPKSSAFLPVIGVAVIVVAITAIFLIFKIIMFVYEVGFLKALEFEVVLIVIGICLWVAEIIFLPHSQSAALASQRETIERFEKTFLGNNAPVEIPSPSPTPETTPGAIAPATPAPSQPPRPGAVVTLIEPVQIAVTLDGTNTGAVTLPRGSRLILVSEDGDQVRVQYLQSVAAIPRKSVEFAPPSH
jgi:hypothetical protein